MSLLQEPECGSERRGTQRLRQLGARVGYERRAEVDFRPVRPPRLAAGDAAVRGWRLPRGGAPDRSSS
jgi:hypothetical protein